MSLKNLSSNLLENNAVSYIRMDGWMDGWMGGWVGGWMGGWMGG